MADFKTHVTVAAVLSTSLSVASFYLEFANAYEAALYALVGTLGGMLPDIDADESIAIRLVFRLFGVLVAGISIWVWFDDMSYWHLGSLGLASYCAVRFPIQWVFEKLTDHRGVLHSLLANVLFTLVAVPIAYHVLGLSAKTAWGVGFFIFFGATIHLMLDEIYSIDLTGMRIKRSFGTALKLTDWQEPLATALFVVGCVLGWIVCPPFADWNLLLAVN